MELKTKVSDASVDAFLATLDSELRRADSEVVSELMQAATGAEAKLWGTNIIGFGHYRYKCSKGKPTDWMQIAFAPRKDKVTLYLMGMDENAELLSRLGKHTRGGGCLHIKKLSDVDIDVLKELIERSVALAVERSI
ncbi:DUF1801 domain-containing protein [Armatimonas rosea]|uniref:YdhG-like domain-containing protein n=1 Tax=Armatimonas rosea TaxID=685828 RepID=A0A7W9SUA7_ARMRO|nr:DUF1801 domain-containing protein [Armatimonas rosea]MBB6052962.1 hypothetical protein [Armatimonas rosea]